MPGEEKEERDIKIEEIVREKRKMRSDPENDAHQLHLE